MDKKTVIKWVAGIVARGVAWILAAKLGMAATEADTTAAAIAEALASLTIVGISIYDSVRSRKAIANGPTKE